MMCDVAALGRHDLIERIRELEEENARWVRRIKELEQRAERALAVLGGRVQP